MKIIICLISTLFFVISTFGQIDTSKVSKITTPLGKEEKNRNVGLNASSNSGPRDINTGIPSNVGGISIMENGLPVVYYPWPESPTKLWRQDASIDRAPVLKISEVAIITGVVGYAVDSYTRMPTDTFRVNGSVGSNRFGLIRGSVNLSGPLKNGWYYTLGASGNFDPATYDLGFTNFSDRTHIYRAGLIRKFERGSVSLNYKYARSWSISNYAPFIYTSDGGSKETHGFRIGRDSYDLIDGKYRSVNILSGDTTWVDMAKDGMDSSHTIDLIGDYKLDNNKNFSYIMRYHITQNSGTYINPLSVFTPDPATDRFTYSDTGESYTDMVQMVETSYVTPFTINSFTSRFELTGDIKKHDWRVGLNEWFYKENKYQSNTTKYEQEVAVQPRKLMHEVLSGGVWMPATDPQGFYDYNVSSEYHNGFENKLALYATDDWDVNEHLTLNGGLRLEYHKLKGDYLPYARPVPPDSLPVKFDNNWFLTRATLGGVFKLTKSFGFWAEGTYNERVGALEDYSGSVEPTLKTRRTPMGQVGIYFNHLWISLVSAYTYIRSTNYQSRLSLVNPNNPNESVIETVYYDISTMGWTTDIVVTSSNGFKLHFLLTWQNPVYKNYAVMAYGQDYDYNNKNPGIPKLLFEIDPSYTFWNNKMNVWLSARYFSKQYANLTNVLYFAPHWETFGGVSYKINKHLDVGVSVINILNQRGASGSIQGSQLVTDPTPFYNTIVVGSYIIPFTIGANLDFKF